MKLIRLSYLFSILLFVACSGEEKTNNALLVVGNVPAVKDGTVIRLYESTESSGEILGVDTVENGSFQFEIPASTELRYFMFLEDSEVIGNLRFWANPGKTEISGDSQYLIDWSVENDSKNQKVASDIKIASYALRKQTDSLLHLVQKREVSYESARPKIDSIQVEINKAEFQIVKKDPNSIPALSVLFALSKQNATYRDEIQLIYDELKTEYKEHILGKWIKANLLAKKKLDVGDLPSNAVLQDTLGNEYNFHDLLSGEYVFLDFWSFGCGPCMTANPEIKEVHATYKGKVKVVGINVDTRDKYWRKGITRDQSPWTNLSDGLGIEAGFAGEFAMQGMPHYAILDPSGKILDQWTGYQTDQIRSQIEKFVN